MRNDQSTGPSIDMVTPHPIDWRTAPGVDPSGRTTDLHPARGPLPNGLVCEAIDRGWRRRWTGDPCDDLTVPAPPAAGDGNLS